MNWPTWPHVCGTARASQQRIEPRRPTDLDSCTIPSSLFQSGRSESAWCFVLIVRRPRRAHSTGGVTPLLAGGMPQAMMIQLDLDPNYWHHSTLAHGHADPGQWWCTAVSTTLRCSTGPPNSARPTVTSPAVTQTRRLCGRRGASGARRCSSNAACLRVMPTTDFIDELGCQADRHLRAARAGLRPPK